jgi:CofD-related protein of GAK system
MKHPGIRRIVSKDISGSIHLSDFNSTGRYDRYPHLGPRILFFSGGSAINDLSRHLTRFTHNSIHIITPFDSGGSTARLRKTFGMPAVGDIRNRLIALSDQDCLGNRETCALFAHRMPRDCANEVIMQALGRMASGDHPLVAGLKDPARKILIGLIRDILARMPLSFDLAGASIGNLILASGYLSDKRQLDTIIYIFSKLANVRGVVRPVVNEHLHLTASLTDGKTIVGQHLITGKEYEPIRSPIQDVYLCQHESSPVPVQVYIPETIQVLIRTADLVVYPMGSFYSSIISNLIPAGIGTAIRKLTCPKIYIPNTSPDPETLGHDLADMVEILLHFLKKDDPRGTSTDQVLNYILLDQENGEYGTIDEKRIRKMGVGIINYPFVTPRTAPLIDEKELVPLLLLFT